jgi:hypothetical protein
VRDVLALQSVEGLGVPVLIQPVNGDAATLEVLDDEWP